MSFIICTFFCVLVLGQEPLKANERLREVNSVLLQTLEQLNVQHEATELTKEEVEEAVGCTTTLTSCGASSCPSGYSDTGRTRGRSCFIGVQKYCCKDQREMINHPNWSPVKKAENAVGLDRHSFWKSATCVDQTGWEATSRHGTVYECIDYRRKWWCNNGAVGSEWKSDWNWIKGNNGNDARTACCECGGGNKPENAVGNKVTELTKEEVEEAVGCISTLTSCGASSCPSGYSDTGRTRGQSCIIGVQKYCCKDTQYDGYKPFGGAPDYVVDENGSFIPPTCVDQTGWKATSRRGTVYECIDYKTRGWCNNGGVGSKWNADWNWIRGNNGKDARTACCECGGGTVSY